MTTTTMTDVTAGSCKRCGKAMAVPAGCQVGLVCESCAVAAERQARAEGLQRSLVRAGMPAELLRYDAALAPHPELLQWCLRHSGQWLWLSGFTGVGKTRALARAVAITSWKAGPAPFSVLWLESALWLESLRSREHSQQAAQAATLAAAKRVDLLVLDDFGQEALDDRTRALLFGLIDHRYVRKGLRTWITTNASGAELEARLGAGRWPQIRRRIVERGTMHYWDGKTWQDETKYSDRSGSEGTNWWEGM